MARVSLRKHWWEVEIELEARGFEKLGYTYLWGDRRIVEDEEIWMNSDGRYILWVNHINAEWFLYKRIEDARDSLKLRGVEWQQKGLFGPEGQGRLGERVEQIWPSIGGAGRLIDNWRFLKVAVGDGIYYYELCRSGELPDDDIVLEC